MNYIHLRQFTFRTGWFASSHLCTYFGVAGRGFSTCRVMAATPGEPPRGRRGGRGKQRHKPSQLKHLKYIERRGGEGSLPPPGLLDLVVVGTGAAGTPRSAFLDMTHFRYLFNCGEGTQRAAMEHKMRLSKLKNIFITHKNWDNIGGLLGMGLSLGGMGLPEITIHGPPNVEKILTMSKGFSPLFLKVDKRDITQSSYEDSAMKIDFIPILPNYSTSSTGSAEPVSKRRRADREEDMSVVYYCQPIQKPRSLELSKAVELGVPRGPALGRLKAGETITLDTGKQVTPDEVLSSPEAITPFLVLEVPTVDYLEPFLQNPTLTALHGKPRKEAPQLIIHFTPPDVLQRPEYQQWMNNFSSDTRHLVLNSGGSVLTQVAPYEIQARLNLIHPGIFPLLPHQAAETERLAEIVPGQQVVPGSTGLKFNLREGCQTSRGFNTDSCVEVNNDEYLLEVNKNMEFQEALAATRIKLEAAASQVSGVGEYPEFLFLGTGSAMPNKIRNVSAILLHTSEDHCLLLDCGEGTYGQLCHHYGSRTARVLRRMSSVFISHLHADHHMGLIGVIEGREKAFEEIGEEATPLTVIVSGAYKKFVDQTDEDVLSLSSKIKMVPIEWFFYDPEENREECQQVLKDLRFKEMKFVRMKHPQFPFGVAMTHEAGWKVAYSGDTMPCDAFIDIGEDCDVLIHEATMEDELIEDALEKKHSTTSQAIEVGVNMRAKFILLTHFSQRYAKIPRFSPSFTDKVGIAFDNMKVRLCDLPLLPLLLPALQALFSEDLQDLEKRTVKRLLNKESRQMLAEQLAEQPEKGEQLDNKTQKKAGKT